jgi:4-amino-4-deoxy-L-arabinose transferase-like glycosyltransferase
LPGPGIGEELIILLLVLIPSLLLVFAIYVLGKEMFDKRVGLIAAALAAVSWTFLFWSNRIQPDFLSMCFQVMAVTCMWKYWKSQYSSPSSQSPPVSSAAAVPGQVATSTLGREERFFKLFGLKTWIKLGNPVNWAALAGIMTAFAFYFKISALLVPMVFIVFILIKDRLSAFKDKGYWVYALFFIMFMLPYFAWAQTTFGDSFAFKAGYIDAPTDFATPGYYNLKFYMSLTSGGVGATNIVMYIVFLAACIWAGLKIMMSLDLMAKDKKTAFEPKLFCMLVFLVVSLFYIFYMRNTDDRWVYLWLPFIFMMVGWVLMEIYKKLENETTRRWLIFGIILFTCFLMFVQYQHADELIKYKADSYGPVKDASLWIKANSPPGAKVLSISYPQTVYYTERNVSTYSTIKSAEEFKQYLLENKPQFMIVSLFEPIPSWTLQWVDEQVRKQNLVPVQGYFQDAAQTQPQLIVYFINGYDNNEGELVSLSNQTLAI